MQPLSSHVLISKAEPVTKTESGIFLPPTGVNDPTTNVSRGEVLAIGNGRYENGVLIPMSVKKGDIVLFNKFAQYPIVKHNGEQCFLILEQALLAIDA